MKRNRLAVFVAVAGACLAGVALGGEEPAVPVGAGSADVWQTAGRRGETYADSAGC